MNRKTVVVLLLATSMLLVGLPESFARPQYLTNLTAVYNNGACGTCHVMPSGQRNFNASFGEHNYSGTYEPRNANRTFAQRNSNGTSRSRNSSRMSPLNSYGTLFENQPNHATDPGAALIAIGPPPSATTNPENPADTAVTATGKASPGFEIMISLIGLAAMALLARRHNK